MLSLLVFIGEAVRDAFDPRKTVCGEPPTPPARPVRDLLASAFDTPARRHRGRGAVRGVSFSTRPRRDARAGRGERLRQVGDGAVASCSSCRIRRRAIPAGSIRFAGQELRGRPRARAAPRARQPHRDGVPGAHDLAQPAPHHREAGRRGAAWSTRACGGRAARARILELLHLVGLRGSRAPARRLSAPALGRPAPAGDDRHGAGQRARSAHRRRAHHRARRHHPGADPAPAPELQQRFGMALLLITHDLGIVRKMADARVRDERGRDRGGRARPPRSSRRRGIPTRGGCWPPSRRRSRARPPPTAPVVHGGAGRQGVVPDQGRRPPPDRGPHQGGGRRERSPCAKGTTVGVVGESGSGKTTLGLALLRLQRSEGADPVPRAGTSRRLGPRALRPLRREMQIVFQDPYGSLSPRHVGGQIVEEGLGVHGIGGDAAAAARAHRRGAARGRARPGSCATAIPTSSPAASASASPSPARSS